MKQLYFTRHGQSELNLRRIYAGQIDTPLTDLGREQARQAGTRAAKLQLDLIVSSPLIRALETAQIIAGKAGYPADQIVTNKLFMEQYQGSLQGTPWDAEINPDQIMDGETEAALGARAQAGLDYLRQLEQPRVLLVGHGSFYLALQGVLQPGIVLDEPPNAEIVQLI